MEKGTQFGGSEEFHVLVRPTTLSTDPINACPNRLQKQRIDPRV